MCTWFYADKATLSPIITKAQQLPLTDTIRNTMSRSAEMSGNIRPTDMAAVFAPNKQGNMAVFPMIWGFTVEQSSKPLINCRIETADRKPVWKNSWFRRRCVIPASWYYEWGILPSEVGFHNANEQHKIKNEKYAIAISNTYWYLPTKLPNSLSLTSIYSSRNRSSAGISLIRSIILFAVCNVLRCRT